MPWALVIAFVAGAICGYKVPVWHFALIVSIVIVTYTVIYHGGQSLTITVIRAMAYAVALEAGYMAYHLASYLKASRKSRRETDAPRDGTPP